MTATAAFTDAGGSAFTPLDAEAGAPREGRERVIPSDPEETERAARDVEPGIAVESLLRSRWASDTRKEQG